MLNSMHTHTNTQKHGHIENLTNHFGMRITNYPVNQIYVAVMYVNMNSLYINVDNLSFKIFVYCFLIYSSGHEMPCVQKVYKNLNV